MQPLKPKFPNNAKFCLVLSFDIEQCTNFPYWTSVWDHLKWAVDEETKKYVGKLADISKEFNIPLHWYSIGKSLEDNIDYLKDLISLGHPIGNHTYRHVNVWAKTFDVFQVTYRNDPSLANGFSTTVEALAHEIQTTSEIIENKLGKVPKGFRTPGGNYKGLNEVPEVQNLLKEQGFAHVSSHHFFAAPESFDRLPCSKKPSWDQLTAAMRANLIQLQPYRYPNGLLEIPIGGMSDIGAFRNRDMDLEEWIRLLEYGIDFASQEGLVFSWGSHPQVIACRDPHAKLLPRLIHRAQEKAGWITTNDELAKLFI